MRRSLENSVRRDKGREVAMLSARCLGEFLSISEYIYYSLLFESDYPELSELFERAAESALGRYRAVGALLLRMGEYPLLNVQPRGRQSSSRELSDINTKGIDAIISDAIERERRGISEYDRLIGYTQNSELLNALPSVISNKRNTLSSLERTFNS